MANIVIPGDGSTLTLNGYAFQDLADGDVITLTFPNDKTSHTVGQNGNSVVKDRINGDVCEVTVNVLKFGSDDIFLNPYSELGASNGLLNGTLQRNFVKDGKDFVESYQLSGGSVMTKPDNTINTQDGEELLAYNIRFTFGKRVI
jgi:hypothetical protein